MEKINRIDITGPGWIKHPAYSWECPDCRAIIYSGSPERPTCRCKKEYI